MTTTKDMADFCTPVANSTMFTARYVFFVKKTFNIVFMYILLARDDALTREDQPFVRG